MSEGKSLKNLLFDATVIIGIITILAYYEGASGYNIKWQKLESNMIPEVPVQDIFFKGGMYLSMIMGIIALVIIGYRIIHGSFDIGIQNNSRDRNIGLLVISIAIILLFVESFPMIYNYIGSYVHKQQSVPEGNKIIEIKLKHREKIENITDLMMLGKRDNFYIFLKCKTV